MTIPQKVTQRSVYAMLSDFGCRQTGSFANDGMEFETKNGRPFELAPPHESGVSAGGKSEQYYERGYVEALREHVLKLTNSHGTTAAASHYHYKFKRDG